MIPLHRKFDAKTSTSKIIPAFRHQFGKLFRREVLLIQCFHWPNIAKCGKISLCLCYASLRVGSHWTESACDVRVLEIEQHSLETRN